MDAVVAHLHSGDLAQLHETGLTYSCSSATSFCTMIAFYSKLSQPASSKIQPITLKDEVLPDVLFA